MPIAIDPTRPWNYVLECDRGTPSPTVWKLKPLTCREHARLQDSMASVNQVDRTINVSSGTQTLEACRMGIVGVDNYFDAGGAPVKFMFKFSKELGREIVSYEFLDTLKPEWRDELAKAITERNEITEADSKN